MDTPPDDALVLRRSDIDSFGYCPKRIELKPLVEPQSSEAMIFGNAVHGAIETYLTDGQKITTRLIHSITDELLLAEYGTTLRRETASSQHMNEFTSEVYSAYREWRKHVAPQLPASLMMEEQMQARVCVLPSGRELWITGIPDYVAVGDFGTELIDWKTAYRMWSEPKMQTTTQPMVYAWLLDQTQGLHASTFTYWIYSRTAGEWASMSRVITQPSVNAAVELVIDVGSAIDAGIYPARPFGSSFSRPRGWWCSPRYCNAWGVCEAKHLITDEIVNDPVVTGWN